MAGLYNSQLDAFDLYHQWSEERRKSPPQGPDLPALGHAAAGSIGASISNLCTYPLDLIITRLQIQRQLSKTSQGKHEEYKSILDAAQKIYKEEGVSGLYTGVIQDTLKTAADSFLFFFVYNSLREARLRARGKKHHLPVIDELGVGFVAGATAKLFTMPISTIVTRMQTTSMTTDKSGSRKKATVAGVAEEIRKEKGLQGFWSGYSATLVLTLNPSLTFLFFENLKLLLVPKSKRESPPAMLTFLIAAISKAVASTITYPFSLAKARTQASRKTPTEPESTEEKKSATRPAARKGQAALQHTILGTVMQIAREEGIGALYQGLEGEVLKGFFSHGFTMLVKDAVHGLILKLYFAFLRLIKKYPSQEEMTTMAKERAEAATSFAKETAEIMSEKTFAARDAVIEKGQNAASYTADQGRAIYEYANEQGKNVTDSITEQGKSTAEYISQHGKSAMDFVSEKTEGLNTGAQNIAEQIRDNIADKAAGIDDFVKEYIGDDGENE